MMSLHLAAPTPGGLLGCCAVGGCGVKCLVRRATVQQCELDNAVTCWLCCLCAGVTQVTIKLGTSASTMFSPGMAEPFATVYPTAKLNNNSNAVLKTSTLVLPLTWEQHGGWAIIENPNGPAEWCALTYSCKAPGPNVAAAQRAPLAAMVP